MTANVPVERRPCGSCWSQQTGSGVRSNDLLSSPKPQYPDIKSGEPVKYRSIGCLVLLHPLDGTCWHRPFWSFESCYGYQVNRLTHEVEGSACSYPSNSCKPPLPVRWWAAAVGYRVRLDRRPTLHLLPLLMPYVDPIATAKDDPSLQPMFDGIESTF